MYRVLEATVAYATLICTFYYYYYYYYTTKPNRNGSQICVFKYAMCFLNVVSNFSQYCHQPSSVNSASFCRNRKREREVVDRSSTCRRNDQSCRPSVWKSSVKFSFKSLALIYVVRSLCVSLILQTRNDNRNETYTL